MVYVIAQSGQPLMPTKRHGWVRRALNKGRATVVKRAPFTIKLTYGCPEETQPVTLGIDAGYATVGFSAVTESEELIAGEFTLLKGMSERLTERRMHRRNRRSRLRHRKPGFSKDTKSNGRLAPSIRHKLDSHIRLVEQLKEIFIVDPDVLDSARSVVFILLNLIMIGAAGVTGLLGGKLVFKD